ncbi:MAG TPA: ATP-binding protein [Candidatus Eisenbacteria bacterium]|nr:ATP-binding protein [Candidatus Eisenbacteria bacterium]
MTAVSMQDESTCPLCGGTGWRDVPGSKEREVVRCECRVKGRAERLLAAAKIPRRYDHCELSTFKYDPDNPEDAKLGKARLAAGRFVEEYPVETTGLLLVGSVGVGKTHLAVGILKALIRDKGVPCLFCDYRELLKSIQNSYNPSVQATEMEILRPVFDAEVLVLDELGAVRSTEWVFDTVNYVLNSRYNDNKTTIITTNFPDKPEQEGLDDSLPISQSAAAKAARRETLGDRIGERMRSRLHEMCKKVEMEGRDYRLHSKKAHFQPIEAPARIKVRGKKESG